MSLKERKQIRGLKALVKNQSNIAIDRNSEIRYLRLQISRLRNEMGKILETPSSIGSRLSRQMNNTNSTRHKQRISKSLSRG